MDSCAIAISSGGFLFWYSSFEFFPEIIHKYLFIEVKVANILKNVQTVFSTHGMLEKYISFLLGSFLTGKPKLPLLGGGSISHFVNFSEFWAMHNNRLSKNELNIFLKECARHGVVFDIGANIGSFSIDIASILDIDTVYAFEPCPATYERLKLNIRLNNLKNIHLCCMALSDKRGSFEFLVNEQSPATNRLCLDSMRDNHEVIQVISETLDAFCHENKIEVIDILKIDVEGAELYVLKGAEELLLQRKIKLIFLEICPENISELSIKIDEIFSFLVSHGYSGSYMDNWGNLNHIDDHQLLSKEVLINIFFFPQSDLLNLKQQNSKDSQSILNQMN